MIVARRPSRGPALPHTARRLDRFAYTAAMRPIRLRLIAARPAGSWSPTWLRAVAIAACLATALAQSPSTETAGLRLDVAITGVPGTVRVTLEHAAGRPVVVVRPRSGMLERYGVWGGWTISVQGDDGAFVPYVFPGAAVVPSAGDLVELRTGESIGATVVLADLVPYAQRAAVDVTTLGESPGRYVVSVTYRFEAGGLPSEDGTRVEIALLPVVRSVPTVVTVR